MAVRSYNEEKNNNNKYQEKRGVVNQPLIFLSGFIILVAAILVYLFVLKGVFGSFTSNDLLPDSEVLGNVVFGSKPKVAILNSTYTENLLPEKSTWLKDNLNTWKKYFKEIELDFKVISDREIEGEELSKFSLLILPGTKALSDIQIINIKKFLENGGSIFATGGTASYSYDGKWRGWQFLSEVFGMRFEKEIGSDDESKVHTLRGGLPLTSNIPTGFPLRVATWDNPMAAEVLDPRTTQVSFWYNYRLEEGLVREEIKKSTGVAYGTYGEGRFVWMGFEINSVIGSKEDYIYFDKLLHNSITWLSYGPLANVSDWPNGYSAAAVITPVLSDKVENIRNLFPILKQEKVPVTFFLSHENASRKKEVLKTLKNFGEIGALVNNGYLSSVNDTINSLDTFDDQFNKLRDVKTYIEAATDEKVIGVYTFHGMFDNNTLTAAIKAGFKYIISDSLSDRSVPKTHIRGEDRILTFIKSARDDYEVIRDFGLVIPEFQFYTYQEDIDRVLFESGLYVYKIHTDYQCKPEHVGVVYSVLSDLKKKNFWIATAREIQQWYEKRDYIEISTQKRGDNRVAVKISNPGVDEINDLVIDLDLNEKADNITIESEIIGTKLPRIKHEKNSQMLYLHIDDLEPGESRTYYIDYNNPA